MVEHHQPPAGCHQTLFAITLISPALRFYHAGFTTKENLMANVNKVILIGNLTRDPELKYLPSQTAVCDFGLAVNRTWTGQDGVKKEETTFVDCSSFGKQAEVIQKYVKKGNPLFVEGRLKLDSWDAQDGSKRYKMRVVVENFQFLNARTGGGGGGGDHAGEYAGEPTGGGGGHAGGGGGGGYAPRQQAPRNNNFNRGGRPAANGGGQQAAPNYDIGDSIPEDVAPQIKDDDIPF
jgi:single-strand DNA-binding protein